MARIRTVKPSIWGDARFAGLSRDARLLVIGLISSADDEGRFIASANAIAGYIYPHDDIPPATIRRWRAEIATTGMIVLYQVAGREYGYFPRWSRHQRINRPNPSAFPPPNPSDGSAASGTDDVPPGLPSDSVSRSVNGAVSDSVSGTPPAHESTSERLTGGREGKGREGRTTQVGTPLALGNAHDEHEPEDTPHEHSEVGALTAYYAKLVPLADHGQAARTITQAIDGHYPADMIRTGLDKLAAEKRTCTPNQLHYAINGAPGNWRPANGQPQPTSKVEGWLTLDVQGGLAAMADRVNAANDHAPVQPELRALPGGAA